MESWLQFETFAHPAIVHGFSGRFPGVGREEVPAHLLNALACLGIRPGQSVMGSQPHGDHIAKVDQEPSGVKPLTLEGPDALVTHTPGVALIVRVADCGPVFFHDPVRRAIGVAHSGRKGTELDIVGQTIRRMNKFYESDPTDLRVQLGPCIRPPHYEVAFAEEIGRQARAAGVGQFSDCGICTGANVDRFYSYRVEKGKTGRMWGVLMLKP